MNWTRRMAAPFANAVSCISLAVLLAFPLFAAIQEPIKIEGGLISGTPGWGWGVREYLGIPFAAPKFNSFTI